MSKMKHVVLSVLVFLMLISSVYRFELSKGNPVIIVGPDGFATIQEAINNADNGDTVFVRAGTYYEHVVVNKTLSLTGENCTTTIVDGNWTGVVINVTRNGVIISGLTVQRSGSVYWENAGIFLGNVENCSISQNILTENPFAGLELNYSRNCSASGNNILGNGGVGITLVGGESHDLSSNSFTENGWGALTLNDANNTTISENNMTSNNLAVTGYSINLYRSSNNSIQKNRITGDNNGIRLEYSSKFNTVSRNNITDNTQTGVSLERYSDNNTISHNMISGSRIGIAVSDSRYTEICNNTIAHNYGSDWGAGVHLTSAGYTMIHDNEVTDNHYGILLYSSSPHVSVYTNIVTENDFGIRVASGGSNYFNATENVVANNTGNGIGITGWGSVSNYATISRNLVANNFDGILLGQYSNYNMIFQNNISQNGYGFYIEHSAQNTIWGNNLVGNDQQVFLATDSINNWNSSYPTGGNHWSDYNGTDANYDGFGDTPYVIDANNTDYYPLMVPNVIPEFPSFLILPLFMMATLLAVAVCRRKKSNAR